MGAQQELPDYPAPVLAAAILAAEGVSFVLVGSAALWLHGEPISVADADVVIEPDEPNLHRLGQVLAGLAVRPQEVPRKRSLAHQHLLGVTTSYGRVDCLLERGRLDWGRLRQSAVRIPVADASVVVAGRADTWALQRQLRSKHTWANAAAWAWSNAPSSKRWIPWAPSPAGTARVPECWPRWRRASG